MISLFGEKTTTIIYLLLCRNVSRRGRISWTSDQSKWSWRVNDLTKKMRNSPFLSKRRASWRCSSVKVSNRHSKVLAKFHLIHLQLIDCGLKLMLAFYYFIYYLSWSSFYARKVKLLRYILLKNSYLPFFSLNLFWKTCLWPRFLNKYHRCKILCFPL